MAAGNRGSTSSALCWRSVGLVAVVAAMTALACPATWAFSPDALPSSAIWINFMQKISEQKAYLVQEVDTDGDTVNDLKTYRHEDGSYIDVKLKPGADGMMVESVTLRESPKERKNWVFGFDRNSDGQIDLLVRGMYADNKWDQMLYDSDRDGRPDTFLVDMDDNGVYDFMGADTDADGKLDALYDLDNTDGKVVNETVGWVQFKEQQAKDALPLLVYSFKPEIHTLSGEEAQVVSISWDYGDGTVRPGESLIPGEHLYAKPGSFDVQLDVQFKVKGAEKVYRAWYGISLPVEAGPAGPAPLTPERVTASVNTLFGACGLLTADEKPRTGTLAELWPTVTIPQGAPAGQALRASAIAPNELEMAVGWWRSEAEATAFLDALDKAAADLPLGAVRATGAQPFELATKVRAHVLEHDGLRTTAWREGGYVVTLTSNRTPDELQRWTRLLYDILHPAPEKAPAGG
jgi:hypothetical protein